MFAHGSAYGQVQTVRAKTADGLVNMMAVDTHFGYGNTPYYGGFSTVIVPKLQELRFRHVRDGLYPSTTKVRLMNWVDMIAQIHGLGVDFVFSIDPRGWPDVSAAVQNAKEVRPAIRIIEGANELDLAQGAIYNGVAFPYDAVAYDRDLYNAFNADPLMAALPVAAGSMAFSSNQNKFCAVTACPISFADYGNMHSYAGANPPSGGLDANIFNTRLSVGNRPIVATETGYHTDKIKNGFPGISESAAAKYLSRLPFEYYNRGVAMVALYELIDELPDPGETNIQEHFGLLRNDGSEKPGFSVLKRTMQLLEDEGASFTPSSIQYSVSCGSAACPTSLHSSLLQKRDGRAYLALWQEVSSYNVTTNTDIVVKSLPVDISFVTPFAKASVYDPFQSATPIRTGLVPSQFNISVPDHAILVELMPPPKLNLVVNGGFEQGLTAWTEDWGSSVIATNAGASGAAALKVGPSAGGMAQFIPNLKPGVTYVISAATKTGSTAEQAWFGLTFLDASGKALAGAEYYIPISTTSYTVKSLSVRAPSSFSRAQVWVWKNAGSSVVYMDNVVLTGP